jgi:hypothetical protein
MSVKTCSLRKEVEEDSWEVSKNFRPLLRKDLFRRNNFYQLPHSARVMVFYLPMWLTRLFRRWLTSYTRDSNDALVLAELPDDVTDEAEVDPFNPFPEPVRLEIRDVFDLHTIAPCDVKLAVEEYLLEARRAGFRAVRIIHGKGMGVQRDVVRGILARTPFVKEWSDAPPEAGGWGATVARLAQDGE